MGLRAEVLWNLGLVCSIFLQLFPLLPLPGQRWAGCALGCCLWGSF